MQTIASSQNQKFKLWRSLIDSKGIKKESRCLVSGTKIVSEVWARQSSEIEAILLRSGKPLPENLHSAPSGLIFEMPFELFQELDVSGTNHPILVKKLPKLSVWNPDSSANGLEVLLPFGDPQNLGAVIRSAVAFGASKLVLLQEAANPFLPKVTRAASGLNLSASLLSGPSIHDLSRVEKLIALNMRGTELSEHQWEQDCRLLVGDEGPGIPNSVPEELRVKIAMANSVESLNATASAAIAMYDYRLRCRSH